MTQFSVQGEVRRVEGQRVVFNPANTNYELHLALVGAAPAPGSSIHALIRLKGRKVWTVASGGNFVAPIAGEPRVIQGRVRQADSQRALVHAGLPLNVELPPDPVCYDLVNGPFGPGALVNITIYPGATLEVAD